MYFGWLAGWPARGEFTMDLYGFIWIYMDLHGFGGISMILELGCRDPLWRPVAACGALWQKAVAPIQYHARSLGLAGWQDGVWQPGWMAGWLDRGLTGWLDGWMVGITAVT